MRRSFVVYTIFLLFTSSIISLNQFVSANEEDELLYVISDTYVSSAYPSLNYGGNELLKIANSTGFEGIKIPYLICDVSSINKEILRVEFHILTSSIVSATQEIGLYTISNTGWSEYDLTYDTQPNEQKNFVTSQPIAVASKWYNWTIPLDRFVNNRTCLVLSVMDQTDSSLTLWFRSREAYSTSDGPHIHVYFDTTPLSGYTLLVVLVSLGAVLSVRKSKKNTSFNNK